MGLKLQGCIGAGGRVHPWKRGTRDSTRQGRAVCLRTREAVCWRPLEKGREEVRQAEQLGLRAVYSKEQGTLEELEAPHGQVPE